MDIGTGREPVALPNAGLFHFPAQTACAARRRKGGSCSGFKCDFQQRTRPWISRPHPLSLENQVQGVQVNSPAVSSGPSTAIQADPIAARICAEPRQGLSQRAVAGVEGELVQLRRGSTCRRLPSSVKSWRTVSI